jgi:hypothetical protein
MPHKASSARCDAAFFGVSSAITKKILSQVQDDEVGAEIFVV